MTEDSLMRLCQLVICSWRFGDACCLHRQGSRRRSVSYLIRLISTSSFQ